MSQLVYMNARRVENEKIADTDGKTKLYPVIYKPGYIYEIDDAAAQAWLKVFVALPIVDRTITFRNGTSKTLSPAKLKQLTVEPDRPNHPQKRGTRPSLDDEPKAELADVPVRKRKRKVKTAGKKKTTRKAGKRGKKKK